MKALAGARIRAVSDFIAACHGAKSPAGLAELIASRLLEFIPGEQASHRSIDHETRTVRLVTRPASPATHGAWEKLLPEHPLLGRFEASSDGRVRCLSDVIGRVDLRLTQLYQQCLFPDGIEDEIGVVLAVRAEFIALVSVSRNGATFTRAERDVFDLLRPHFLQAHRSLALAHETRQALFGLDDLLAGEGRCVLRLDSQNRVRHWPALSVRWLGKKELPGALSAWLESRKSGASETPVYRFRHADGPVEARLRIDPDNGQTVLILKQPRSNPGAAMTAEMLTPLGLSPRRREVLFWAAQGKTNVEIAGIMGIATPTVKKQMEHILDHLGVETRTAAVVRATECL